MTVRAAFLVALSDMHLARVSKKLLSSLVLKIEPLFLYVFSINDNDSFLHVFPADLSSRPY